MKKWPKGAILCTGVAGLIVPGITLVSCGTTTTTDEKPEPVAEVTLTTKLDNLSLANYHARNANWDGYAAQKTDEAKERARFATTGYNLMVAGTTQNANQNISAHNYKIVGDLLASDAGQAVITKLDAIIKNQADFITYFNDESKWQDQENEIFLLITTMVTNNPVLTGDEALLAVDLQQALSFATNKQQTPASFDFGVLAADKEKQSFTINGVTKESYAWTSDSDIQAAMMFFLEQLETHRSVIFATA